MRELFRVADRDLLDMRCWDDGCVLFDARTGRTHQLDTVASQILTALQDSGALTVEALFDTVFAEAPATGPAMSLDERRALVDLLEQLRALQLLETVPLA
jgi:PqqD family protein of HPr-rel-A system